MVKKMKHISLKGLRNIGKVAKKILIVQNERIVIQIGKTKKQNLKVDQKTQNYDQEIRPSSLKNIFNQHDNL